MPSMLGLTTDPSPHGLGSKENWMGGKGGQNEGDMQVAKRKEQTENSIVPGLNSDFFNRNKTNEDSKDDDDDDESDDEKLNTIKGRNHAAAKEMETLLWRALCDKPKSAKKYLAKDAIVSNKFLFGDPEVRSKDSDPPLEEELKNCHKWLAYKMHDPQVVEIDLMAVALTYRVTLFRQVEKKKGNNGIQTIEATVSSSWRQVASGDYVLTSMMAA
ncbi:Fc.00g018960.m01.CDS01 [Cosmosporella sp. VM-42]